MKTLNDYTIVLRPETNGTFVAHIPAIPGCHARGTIDIKGNSDCSITPNKLLNYTIYLFTFLPFTTPFISFLL